MVELKRVEQKLHQKLKGNKSSVGDDEGFQCKDHEFFHSLRYHWKDGLKSCDSVVDCFHDGDDECVLDEDQWRYLKTTYPSSNHHPSSWIVSSP